jgi:hypothetical protein
MNARDRTAGQLAAIDWLHAALTERTIDYWLFGGWAVDFHVGRVSRDHEDVDLAVWRSDLAQLRSLLSAEGWVHAPEPGEDGYTGYERAGVRLELAFLVRDDTGIVYTPLTDGRGDWPPDSFGDAVAELAEVQARVVSRKSLIADKCGPRDNPAAAAKDRADVAYLRASPTRED